MWRGTVATTIYKLERDVDFLNLGSYDPRAQVLVLRLRSMPVTITEAQRRRKETLRSRLPPASSRPQLVLQRQKLVPRGPHLIDECDLPTQRISRQPKGPLASSESQSETHFRDLVAKGPQLFPRNAPAQRSRKKSKVPLVSSRSRTVSQRQRPVAPGSSTPKSVLPIPQVDETPEAFPGLITSLDYVESLPDDKRPFGKCSIFAARLLPQANIPRPAHSYQFNIGTHVKVRIFKACIKDDRKWTGSWTTWYDGEVTELSKCGLLGTRSAYKVKTEFPNFQDYRFCPDLGEIRRVDDPEPSYTPKETLEEIDWMHVVFASHPLETKLEIASLHTNTEEHLQETKETQEAQGTKESTIISNTRSWFAARVISWSNVSVESGVKNHQAGSARKPFSTAMPLRPVEGIPRIKNSLHIEVQSLRAIDYGMRYRVTDVLPYTKETAIALGLPVGGLPRLK
ncbi:hypothetical protein Hypma_004990 [Hypsizygus marmoreus]|uniref:Uncharacterized protein n=1 Tax=Hypsizygus marmoreus TaxID=39966 RepID=A0A369JX99_HYPMA|nr:hypothetical protein Hypma_004990 [Hypsizygus marmoreus]